MKISDLQNGDICILITGSPLIFTEGKLLYKNIPVSPDTTLASNRIIEVIRGDKIIWKLDK